MSMPMRRCSSKQYAFPLLLCALLFYGCATPRPQGTVIELSGVINPLRMDGSTCWILETGTMKDKAFYELRGKEHILQRLQRENVRARVRALLLPNCTPLCGIGACVEVTEILELQP